MSIASSISLDRVQDSKINPHITTVEENLPLFIVDACQVAMDNGMVGTKRERPKVGSYCSVKYSCLLQHIAQVDVSIEECWVKLNSLGM